MKNTVKNILLVGVGGQGTILMSKILAEGLAELGYDIKMSEIHGMSQRGGSVTTQVRFGDKVYSPTIGLGEADVLVAFEKAEAVRALPYLKKGGRIFMDSYEIMPVSVLSGAAEYVHGAAEALEAAGVQHRVIEAYNTAAALGEARAQNIIMLGALVKALELDDKTDWRDLVARFVPARAREINLSALEAGLAM